MNKLRVNNSASIFLSYAILLTAVLVALTTMSIYIKRGVQGKVKDMTDYFISERREVQVQENDPEYTLATSRNQNRASSTLEREELLGGGVKLGSFENVNLSAESYTEDRRKAVNPASSSFVSWNDINVTPAQRPDNSEFADEDLSAMDELAEQINEDMQRVIEEECNGDPECIAEYQRRIDEANQIQGSITDIRDLMNTPPPNFDNRDAATGAILSGRNYDMEEILASDNSDFLQMQRDKILTDARAMEVTSERYAQQGQALINQASRMSCPSHHGGSCRRARRNLRNEGQNLINNTSQASLAEAERLMEDAALIQQRIDELGG